MRISHFVFVDDGDIPNNPLPLILYEGAIDSGAGDAARAFETLFAANGWGGSWRNGIYPFHHYHSTAHEVLGIAAGTAEVRFGGEAGATVTVRARDAVLIPAGVGHKRLSEKHGGFTVVGGYPADQSGVVTRAGEMERAEAEKRIAALALPAADPVSGYGGPLPGAWKLP